MVPSILAVVVLLVGGLLSMSAPVFATTLYTWRNADGSLVFTDNPKGAPPDVQVRVWSDWNPPEPKTTPEPEPALNTIAAVPPVEESPEMVTQGEFVVRLVEELGLHDRPDADRAADILTRVRIAPRLGRWELDGPMTPELTLRLRSLTAAAAAEGWITLTPEEGLLAFDTTAALLGVTIPETGEMDRASDEASPPIDETPPLVYVNSPPPGVYPYYLWQPVDGGYGWNGAFFSGIYILDFDRFSPHHYRHRHEHQRPHDRHPAMTPDRIGRHFRSHMAPNHPQLQASSRPYRAPGAPGSFGVRRPERKPPAASMSSTLSQSRVVRGSGPTKAPDLAATRELPRGNRPGVRFFDTRAVVSERSVVSREDGASKSEGRGVGAVRGQSHGRGFASR